MSEDICQNMSGYGAQCIVMSGKVTACVTAATVHSRTHLLTSKRDLVKMTRLSCFHVAYR